jgi:hypothetical protein
MPAATTILIPLHRGKKLLACAVLAYAAAIAAAAAQEAPGAVDTGQQNPPAVIPAAPPVPPSDAPPTPNTTVVPRSTPPAAQAGQDGEIAQIRLVAQLTSDGQHIDQGLVWRVFQEQGETEGKSKLLSTYRDASPIIKLAPGKYIVNAAFGRAHLTRTITVKAGAGAPSIEQFVLNAGGLRVTALVGKAQAPQNSMSYSIYSDRDQSDNRKLIMGAVKPGVVIRLNAGIYHIVSTYGDSNATVRSDVTVEAGKLTETTVTHAAAKATFKLVNRAGGEALPDTQWTIETPQGEVVKESVGALPTHILAPGSYVVVAKSQSKAFQREFTLEDGETTQVEVIIK